MNRRIIVLLLLLCGSAVPALAQDLGNIQIHGFATQGVLYSSHNNFFTTNSTKGSVSWTDAAISVSDSVTDKLRVGIQLHVYELGQLGGPHMDVDWVFGDYKLSEYAGIRAGKVKTRLGLFNDVQDVDAVYLWSLLPESMYQTDNKSFFLAHWGFDFYGAIDMERRGGKVIYTGYVGRRELDLIGGYANSISQPPLSGIFPTSPSGTTYGGDVRWQLPIKGATVGVSDNISAIDGTSPSGGIHSPPSMTYSLYGKYERGKFYVGGEYRRDPEIGTIPSTALHFALPFALDTRAWYVMTSYRVVPKLQVGTYYSHYEDKSKNVTFPANYSKDWTISGRFDFNQYFYAKIEGHFVHGTALDFYSVTNPSGNKVNSNLLVAKIGFAF